MHKIVLQKHYATLQALALDEDAPELDDLTLPDLDKMAKHQATIKAFAEACGSSGGAAAGDGSDDEGTSSSSNRGTKRKAESKSTSSRATKAAPKSKKAKGAKGIAFN
jgi:hypothetical protein